MANTLTLEFQLPTDAELDRMFDMAAKMNRHKLTDQVVDAGSAPVLARARELAPRSSVTGTARLRSKKQRQEADWAYPLWKTIKRVIRKYEYTGIAIIGPSWPKGNKAYLNTSPKGRRQVLWGNRTGRVVPQIRNWIVQAFDETKSEQLTAMKAKATSVIHLMMMEK